MAKKRQTNKLMPRLIDGGARLVEETDKLLDQAGPFFARQSDEIIGACAGLVTEYDNFADLAAWFFGRSFVKAARRWHDLHIILQQHRK